MAFDNLLIRTRSVSKFYDEEQVLSDFNLDVWKGSITGILGSSGSGKTTALRLIAGFDRPDSGIIEMKNEVIVSDEDWLPPEKRNIGMVFQDYALFPHLSVEKNIAFGLGKNDLEQGRLKEVIDMCNLSGLINKFPQELSGGQQQRVALARALAPNPEVVLLDEPFTSLDAQMARVLRDEVVELLKNTETTAIIVTHDQEEALSVCDVVSVLEKGKIIQSSTPQEIYLNPVSKTVANSVGDPNILKGFSIDGRVETSLGTFVSAYEGALDVSIRPECIELKLDSEGNYIVKECTFYGHDQVISFQNSKGEVFRARSLPNTIYEAGDKVNIEISEVTTFPSKV
ncbi:MAG: ABC transporter ATP-binding protein [Candidatus Actinomarina sp.]|jgi:iron(III) transport system ATP-binding protein|nr:ABC transporter ATP-binding protein [Candidatus Actinomarina sp.]MBL6762585.1 ABC transporter ATP-binding protein [Candidatus Actinomarina sp.]MBL6835991.1 ABC transporter ATP-binding protein [Candidatus Actinomarina sp.]